MARGAEIAGAREELTAPADAEPVPFFSQARTFDRIWPSLSARVGEILDDGVFSHGRQVAELERRIAECTGARFAVGVGSGTDALVLLLRAIGLRPGDEVVVPAYSFAATAASVVLAGGRPAFADIDPVTYALDPAEVDRAAGPRTRFVMPAHACCQMADMSALSRVAARRGLTLLEDSAAGIGMRQLGVHAGLHGAGGVLSFFPDRTLGALGDAGMVLTDDARIAHLVSALRHHGEFGRTLDDSPGIPTDTAVPGTNSKMDDIQAAVLLTKMTRLDEDVARRAELADAYREGLSGIPGVLGLPELLERGPGSTGVFSAYVVEVEHRDALVEHLRRHGIGTQLHHPVPLHLQPCFADLGHRRGDFPRAERASERALALPLYPDLTLERIDRVCAAVRGFYQRRCG